MRGESAHYSADFRVGFDWLKTSTRQIILIWPRLSGRCFPSLGSWCMYLLGDLIGSFYHLCVPWLAKVVALITTTTISLGINTIKNISFFLWLIEPVHSLFIYFFWCVFSLDMRPVLTRVKSAQTMDSSISRTRPGKCPITPVTLAAVR